MPNSDEDVMLNEWLATTTRSYFDSIEEEAIQYHNISIVPKGLKESNEDATYMPRVVSIGPIFKGSRKNLHFMEGVKLRCMKSLIHRAADGNNDKAKKNLEWCSQAMWSIVTEVRASYVDDFKLETRELANILLLDGCFLLDLLVTKGLHAEAQPPSKFYDPAPQVLNNEDVLSDLMLLENQIPIIVIEELTQILFPTADSGFGSTDRETRTNVIINLVLRVLGYPFPQVQISNPAHILDVVHSSISRKGKSEEEIRTDDDKVVTVVDTPTTANLKLKRCASRLQAAGVTIKLLEDDIPDEDLRGLDIQFRFKKGILEIKQLHITETTKAKWRNLIAWEHHKKNWNRSLSVISSGDKNKSISSGKLTSSALIFDGLICCDADIKLLKDKNILVDHVKKRSNEDLTAFLRTMSFGVDHEIVDSDYVEMVHNLNNYSKAFFFTRMCKVVWHLLQWLFTFMHRNYNFVATMLAVLAVVQTIFAILDFFLH